MCFSLLCLHSRIFFHLNFKGNTRLRSEEVEHLEAVFDRDRKDDKVTGVAGVHENGTAAEDLTLI